MTIQFRRYRPDDADSWLRCRLLSFFGTCYFDDVLPERPSFGEPSICLVAHEGFKVVGLMDTAVNDSEATIDSVAVHPDAARRGIASQLLARTIPQLRAQRVSTLDAWTREDRAANAWYRTNGFVEKFRYLHVHKESSDDDEGFESPPGMSRPVRAFAHAPIEMESELRARYRRTYVCRQYVLQIDPDAGSNA